MNDSRNAHRYQDEGTNDPSKGPNFGTILASAIVGLLLVRSKQTAKATPHSTFNRLQNGLASDSSSRRALRAFSPPGGSEMGQVNSSNWIPWVLGGAAAFYVVKKLLEYASSIENDPPVQNRIPPPAPVPYSNPELMASLKEALERPITATWTPPVDACWLRLAPHPSVILILGKRGSGKSALGYRLLELLRNQAAPYVVGLPRSSRKLLPEWIGCVDRLEDAPHKAIVLMDESYMQYHARDSMGTEGRTIGQMVNLSRQKQQSLIFIVQEARQLDVNAISQADVIAIKELSEISRVFERRELRRFTDKAQLAFAGVNGNRQRFTWVYSDSSGDTGLFENEIATFWKPALSRAFAQGTARQDSTLAPHRKGVKTPKEELVLKAKSLRNLGHSYGEIAKMLGISKTSAFDYAGE